MATHWTAHTHSARETQQLAAQLSRALAPGDVVWLSGELGAGKTTFTQGLAAGLQVDASVISPTFVLVREYAGRLPLYHIDLYRLDDTREIRSLGLRDYLDGEGVCVIEWAERYDAERRAPGLHVRIEPQGDDQRQLIFTAAGTRAEQLLAALQTEVSSHAPRH